MKDSQCCCLIIWYRAEDKIPTKTFIRLLKLFSKKLSDKNAGLRSKLTDSRWYFPALVICLVRHYSIPYKNVSLTVWIFICLKWTVVSWSVHNTRSLGNMQTSLGYLCIYERITLKLYDSISLIVFSSWYLFCGFWQRVLNLTHLQ